MLEGLLVRLVIAALAGGGVVGWLVKYLMDRRKRSGRIDTTEAKQLWAEQEQFRIDLRKELRRRVRECKEELAEFQLQNLELRIENHQLRGENMTLQFLAHPDVPQDLKDSFLQHQRIHIAKLQKAYEEARVKQAELAEERDDGDERRADVP